MRGSTYSPATTSNVLKYDGVSGHKLGRCHTLRTLRAKLSAVGARESVLNATLEFVITAGLCETKSTR